jgi:hypothetical protein
MTPDTRRSLFRVLAKIASLEMLLGGPLLVSDELRRSVGVVAAMIVVVVPVVLFYAGADALAESERDRVRRRSLRLGALGAWLIAPMNAYGYWRVTQGDIRSGPTTMLGVMTCTLLIVAYLFLARRALRRDHTVPNAETTGDFGGPIE